MSQALYRKYRSRSLEEIVGQEHITSMLRRAIDSGTIAHAYLLTGPRGVGKTSIARIIAHEINRFEYSDESDHLDIIEIDAASNNGVEDVRELRNKIHIAPSSADKKVYIIDEVHMLSKPAFNALLKTLEEPPEHAVFILATTDVEKLPATIISRVQQFNFRAIPEDTAVTHLRNIAGQESIDVDDEALHLIARHGEGSFRDSISLLDQLRHSVPKNQPITPASIRSVLGAGDDELIDELISAYRADSLPKLISTIDTLESSGAYAGTVCKQLITKLRAQLSSHPQDIRLLDGLLEVPASSYPYIKLLTVLAGNVTGQHPPIAPAQPSHGLETPKAKTARAKSTTTTAEAVSPPTDEAVESSKPKSTTNVTNNSPVPILSWQALLDAASQDIALMSLLSRCKHDQQGDTVTIYAGSKFNAEKLSSARQQPKLRAALEKIGAADVTLHIKADKAPLPDSQAAAVAVIMGGGEEVVYNG